MPVTLHTLREWKREGHKFAVLTAYEATMARVAVSAGVPCLLVGDSLGNVIQGRDSTVPVTVAEMAYHTACVARGSSDPLLIADMPFMSYATPGQAFDSAMQLMQAGAHMVKLEGGGWLTETVQGLAMRGVPVCAHLGLLPQSVNKVGGYRVQGREPEDAKRIAADAEALQQAGADLLVLECVPSPLAARISQQLTIPVIGIGAGPDTDAQVLVLHDLLGLNPKPARFVRNFMQGEASIADAIASYVRAVESGEFPGPEHQFD